MLVRSYYANRCHTCRNYIPSANKKTGYCTLKFQPTRNDFMIECYVKKDKKKPKRVR